MILACSLVLPTASSSQGRSRAKKGQTAVKLEEEDMQAGPSTSQPDAVSQQEAEMEVAAVLAAGVDLTEDADETAVPLLDRLAGMLMHAGFADPCCRDSALHHYLYRFPQVHDSTQIHASNHTLLLPSSDYHNISTAIKLITARLWLLEVSVSTKHWTVLLIGNLSTAGQMDALKVESSKSQSSKAHSAVRSTAAAAKTAKPARAAAKKAASYVDLLDRSA